MVLLLIRCMDSWRAFDLVNAITKGGPGSQTETLSMYGWMQGFAWWNTGRASAIGIFMLFITIATTWFFVNGIPTIRRIRSAGEAPDKPEYRGDPRLNLDTRLETECVIRVSSEGDFQFSKKQRSRKKIKRLIYEKVLLICQILFTLVLLLPFLSVDTGGFYR